MAQTFDSFLNQFLEHNHGEYALKDEVATITDIDKLQNILQELVSKYNELYKNANSTKEYVNKTINQNYEDVASAIKFTTEHLIELISKQALDLSSGIMDGGKFNASSDEIVISAGGFNDPNSQTVIDAGGFEKESVAQGKQIKETIINDTDKKLKDLREALRQNMDTLPNLYVFKEDFLNTITRIDNELANRLKELPKHIHDEYALKTDLNNLALKSHQHKEYALKSSLKDVVYQKDLPKDYVPANEFIASLKDFKNEILALKPKEITKIIKQEFKVPARINLTEIKDAIKSILKRLKKIEEEPEKANLNHKHPISDIISLSDQLGAAPGNDTEILFNKNGRIGSSDRFKFDYDGIAFIIDTITMGNDVYVYRINDVDLGLQAGIGGSIFMQAQNNNPVYLTMNTFRTNDTHIEIPYEDGTFVVSNEDGDIGTSNEATGLILKDSNNVKYRITVDTSGNLVTTAI